MAESSTSAQRRDGELTVSPGCTLRRNPEALLPYWQQYAISDGTDLYQTTLKSLWVLPLTERPKAMFPKSIDPPPNPKVKRKVDGALAQGGLARKAAKTAGSST
ncbi:hypothetical protein BDR04DRAFT_1142916 [Suillus decipiens]|nr:hypothetical protein BDR04DRAFT_1142916 [Suillus decipiens]